jgi:hypothetical protein
VEIRFETQEYLDRSGGDTTILEGTTSPLAALLPDLNTTAVRLFTGNVDGAAINFWQVHQWTFKNDGIAFRDEDWNRLKKIG